MSNEERKQLNQQSDDSERAGLEEAIDTIVRTTECDELISLPWLGWQYKNEP